MPSFNSNLAHSQAEKEILAEIEGGLKKALGKSFSAKLISIDYPPQSQPGDFTVPCFLLAKKLKQNPARLAYDLASKFKADKLIARAKAAGPYLNFFIKPEGFAKLVLSEIYKAKQNYGQNKIGRSQKVMVEYFSPNTNKPLTVGHIRNICLGQSLAGILRFCGYKVIQSTLYNDRGIAIAKAIAGYQKWGAGQTPKTAGLKPDHFVGDFYAKFCREEKTDPNLESEAKRVLSAWEADDKEIKSVWQTLMTWVLEGFKETLAALGVERFDEEYYESEYYRQGKEIVERGLKSGVFIKDAAGVILAPLLKFGLPDKIVLRPDDTSLYVTQDLHLAYLKDKYRLDQSIYVVGSEQDLYFKQLFKILELLGFANAKNYRHLSYGMIRLGSGKIKSREGLIKGTGADDLIGRLEELAGAEVAKRYPDLPEKEITKRAGLIALAALRYYILAVRPQTTMIFDPEKSLAFTGKTGPYLQYVYARISSLFAKSKAKVSSKVNFAVLADERELELIRFLARFPKTVAQSARAYDPSLLADYLYNLARAFSLFYETLPVLKAEEEIKKARLLLIASVRTVLATGLALLGIEAPEKM
ncbi:MAG: arginine--tRNA ligase [Candidatus Buchananbacteria bacterium RIFCSPHIGHO2_01_FULL_46_12]|uniref:Arginine--tRNA ligase n=1 Tax=Candidatus Buchananbacteria bacterium RIFCSPHIGHO2_01_FULL_46_12 TaxID=1797536 RepID=A0A1G1Y529_9BACT|nr:MAG: arginine--tRNA ligase [Candidatus Buchananbacteria bacterium RIFCSPHIGHO2_01_FULL_46_12]